MPVYLSDLPVADPERNVDRAANLADYIAMPETCQLDPLDERVGSG